MNNRQEGVSLSTRYHKPYTYFSTWFKEETCKNFSDCVMKRKMNRVKRLLKDLCLRINEVANEVSRENAYHFSRAFK